MTKTYGSKAEKLTPITIPDEVLIAIGRLVRACAEIEDLVTLYISNLAEISESRAVVLLGRAAITRRLEMAKYFAQMTGKQITGIHAQIFNTDFWDIISCRNAVAHGVLLGAAEDGRFAFLTAKTAESDGPSAIQIVESYDAYSIKEFARRAESLIPLVEKHLKLGALRQERLQRPLLPHRKAQPRQNSARKPRQRSSRKK